MDSGLPCRLGVFLLAAQAADGEPGPVSERHGGLPEAAILIALVACLLVDLAGEKVSGALVPPICYAGPRREPADAGTAMECSQPMRAFPRCISGGQPRRGLSSGGRSFNPAVVVDQLALRGAGWNPGRGVRRNSAGRHGGSNVALRRNGFGESIFVSLETLSVSSYLLSGYMKRDARSSEAALKYLLVGSLPPPSFSAASLLYGLSGGSTNLDAITSALQGSGVTPLSALALVFVLATVAFKISAVPFHQWTPDVYEGLPHTRGGFPFR